MQPLLTGGRITADQVDGWNGAPDRFEWKLVGKRELLIGYNAYRLADRTLRYPDIIKPRNLDPDLLRYERHRVWVVEATRVKHHKFYRRVFYVDEDTWQVAQEEAYDKKGALERFGDYHMIQFYDVQVPWYAATINHEVKSGQVPGDLPRQHGALPHALGVHGPDERLHPEPPAQPGTGVGGHHDPNDDDPHSPRPPGRARAGGPPPRRGPGPREPVRPRQGQDRGRLEDDPDPRHRLPRRDPPDPARRRRRRADRRVPRRHRRASA